MLGIGFGISDIGAALAGAVSSLAAAIGGAVAAAGHLVPLIPANSPLGLGLRIVIEIASKVIPVIAEILIGKPAVETPEELGMKAEKAPFTLDDCDNDTEQYIQRLRDEIHLDRDAVENLSEEDRAKYAVLGAELYMQGIEEHYGVKLGAEFLSAVTRADMQPERIAGLILALSEEGIKDGAAFDRYLQGALPSGSRELLAVSTAHEKMLESELKTGDIKAINAAVQADIDHYRGFTAPAEDQ